MGCTSSRLTDQRARPSVKEPPSALAVAKTTTSIHVTQLQPQSKPSDVRALRGAGDLPSGMVAMEYAVRGRVVEKAAEFKERLRSGEKLPFADLIFCNIGNPHAVRQPPITFFREVVSALYHPRLCDDDFATASGFGADVIDRARAYHAATSGGVGAYTDSIGLKLVREQVAAFIEQRDGYPGDPEHLALTTGASEGVKRALAALVRGPSDGVLIPKPQYPLYSATLTMCGGSALYYELDEARGWSVGKSALERSLEGAAEAGVVPRALCLINPGNPVGAVLSEEAVATILTFAALHGLVVLADEVYQANVYDASAKFHSCKRVLRRLQSGALPLPPGFDGGGTLLGRLESAQLVSFHSTSKGLLGECGERGGYMEFVGFPPDVLAMFSKVAASSLCSGTVGQVFVGLMVTPPAQHQPSFDRFASESAAVFDGLRRRALLASTALNAVPGLSTAPIQGAMYAFPSVSLPSSFLTHAAQQGVAPDELWCVQLLEATGIVTVPGSGFGQAKGTHHFRMTILPDDATFADMLERLKGFQSAFYARWGDALAA